MFAELLEIALTFPRFVHAQEEDHQRQLGACSQDPNKLLAHQQLYKKKQQLLPSRLNTCRNKKIKIKKSSKLQKMTGTAIATMQKTHPTQIEIIACPNHEI